MSVDYDHDVCARCHRVIDLPGDGSPSSHVCVHDLVPWRRIRREARFPAPALRRLARTMVRFDQARDPVYGTVSVDGDVTVPDLSSLVGDPRREGPFEPACPPPPVLMSDLLLWSREDLTAVDEVGQKLVDRLEAWLQSHGLELARRDVDGTIAHLAGALRRIFGTEDVKFSSRESVRQLGRELDAHRYPQFAVYYGHNVSFDLESVRTAGGTFLGPYMLRRAEIEGGRR